jgi:hypothetical protein
LTAYRFMTILTRPAFKRFFFFFSPSSLKRLEQVKLHLLCKILAYLKNTAGGKFPIVHIWNGKLLPIFKTCYERSWSIVMVNMQDLSPKTP